MPSLYLLDIDSGKTVPIALDAVGDGSYTIRVSGVSGGGGGGGTIDITTLAKDATLTTINTSVGAVNTSVGTSNSYLDVISQNVDAVLTYSVTIANNTGSSSTSLGTAVNHLANISSYTSPLNTSLGTINTSVGATNTALGTSNTHLNNIYGQVFTTRQLMNDNVVPKLNSIDSSNSTQTTYLDSVSQYLSSVTTAARSSDMAVRGANRLFRFSTTVGAVQYASGVAVGTMATITDANNPSTTAVAITTDHQKLYRESSAVNRPMLLSNIQGISTALNAFEELYLVFVHQSTTVVDNTAVDSGSNTHTNVVALVPLIARRVGYMMVYTPDPEFMPAALWTSGTTNSLYVYVLSNKQQSFTATAGSILFTGVAIRE